MNKALKIYLGLFVCLIVVLVFLEKNKKQVIDWSLNYKVEKKSPFGLYILDQEIDELFSHQVERVGENPYLFLERDSLRPVQNYLLIEEEITSEGYDYLLKEVDKGSSLFVAQSSFSSSMLERLGVVESYIAYNESDVSVFRFTDKHLQNTQIEISEQFNYSCFSHITEETTEILGYVECDSVKEAAFVRVKYGKGGVYLFTQPLLFTNFYLKEPKNTAAIEQIMSYLPYKKTIWFQKEAEKRSVSEFRYVLQNDALRYTWYLVLAMLLLYLIFHAKRRQRVVPLIAPKENKTLEFVRSIGYLYLQEGHLNEMAKKKIQYFLYKVRQELHLNTQELDSHFERKLQMKTGKSLEEIQQIVDLVRKIESGEKIITREKELIAFNQLLDKIY